MGPQVGPIVRFMAFAIFFPEQPSRRARAWSFVPASTFTAHPYAHDKLPYDAERDLLPITNVTTIVIAISAPTSLNVKTLGEFIALARAKPDTLNVAAAAGNSDLILSAFIKTQGLPMSRVPYRDIQQAPSDLAEARIHLLMSSYATMLPAVSGSESLPTFQPSPKQGTRIFVART